MTTKKTMSYVTLPDMAMGVEMPEGLMFDVVQPITLKKVPYTTVEGLPTHRWEWSTRVVVRWRDHYHPPYSLVEEVKSGNLEVLLLDAYSCIEGLTRKLLRGNHPEAR